MTKYQREAIGKKVIGAAITVHRQLGPGLLESVYEWCLIEELQSTGIFTKHQVHVPIYYKGKLVPDKHFRLDLLVADEIILEIKAVEAVHPVHVAQLLTYLKLANKHLGYLLNFNVEVMKNGIYRRVYGYT